MGSMGMNSIGIEDNLNRARIRKLFIIGLVGCVLTGAGDFLLGYAVPADVGGGMFDAMLATAPNTSDMQLVIGGLLGAFGLFLEGMGYFGVYRLMADAAPKYAHVIRSFIFGYIWTAPIACHMNVAVLNIAYKYLWNLDPVAAHDFIAVVYPTLCVPLYLVLACFWIPAMVVQFKAFAQGCTPYPPQAKWFTVLVGAVPALVVASVVGAKTALGGGVGTMFLSFGNAFVFGGLLATMPSDQSFQEFRMLVAVDEAV